MPSQTNTCGACGHYVRLIGAEHSHRCALTCGVIWPERPACEKGFVQAREMQIRVEPKPEHRGKTRGLTE